jgi:pilus assembly protein CpaB
MEKKTNKKALIISLIFALLCCGFVYYYVSNLEKPEQSKPQTKILVASRNINAGEEIKAGDINASDISEDSIPVGIVNDRKLIEGFFAKEPIIMGEPFRQERISKREDMELAFNIPDGMRAISVFVNENTILSNQLKVGNRVDVIGNYSIEAVGDKKIDLSKITIQDVQVLAIGSSRVNAKSGNAGSDSAGEANLPKTVTLCVTPADAEKMAYISNFANFTFVLRGQEDDNKVNTPGTIIDNIVPYSVVQ